MHAEAIVHVPPSNTEDLDMLSKYLTLIYPVFNVDVYGRDSRVIRIRGGQESSAEELCNAQNFALRFLGPESIVVLMMPLAILQLCTLHTLRRYLAINCRVIVTVRRSSALILRGPCEATRQLNLALKNLQKTDAHLNEKDKQAKLYALQGLCSRLDIAFAELDGVELGLKSSLFNLLVVMESVRRNGNPQKQQFRTAAWPSSPAASEPAFVEAFRKCEFIFSYCVACFARFLGKHFARICDLFIRVSHNGF